MKITNNYYTSAHSARTNSKPASQNNNSQNQVQQNKVLFQSCSINSSRDHSVYSSANCTNIIESIQELVNPASCLKSRGNNSNYKNDK
jgi:hypothetical protein